MLRSRGNFGQGGEGAPLAIPRIVRSPARKSPARAFPSRRGHGTLGGPFPAAPWWKAAREPTSPLGPSQGGRACFGHARSPRTRLSPEPDRTFCWKREESTKRRKAGGTSPSPSLGATTSSRAPGSPVFSQREDAVSWPCEPVPCRGPLCSARRTENRIRPAKTFQFVRYFPCWRFFTMV